MKTYRDTCRILFGLGMAAIPISIVAAQAFLYLPLLLWLAEVVARRRWGVFRNPFAWWILAFVALCGLSILVGLNGDRAVHKVYRLSLLLLVFAVPDWFGDRPWKAAWVFAAFVSGCLLLTFYDLVRVPLEVAHLERESLAHTGNMRDPQFYMVGLVMLVVIMLSVRNLPLRVYCLGPTLFCLVGLFLHQKMGSFAGFAAALVCIAFLFRKWPLVLVLFALGATVFAVHRPTRERVINKVASEFDPAYGARGTLWMVVGPGFVRANPLGAGYKSTRYEDLVPYKGPYHMEIGLDHLHNNPYQILAELGVLGPLVWLPWMAFVLWYMFRKRGSPGGKVVLLAFIALSVNGMFEYNFGDTEPFMLFCALMGLACLPPFPPVEPSGAAAGGPGDSVPAAVPMG